MILNATVLETSRNNLLVRDAATGEEILVHTPNAQFFSPGDTVRIVFDGRMTLSIPPQITATSIQRTGGGGTPSGASEMRAVILQKGNRFLIVRNLQDNVQYRVNYNMAHHFCVRQRVNIQYDTLTLTSPPTINAVDITPIC